MEKFLIASLVATFITIYIVQFVAKKLKSERPSFGMSAIVVIVNSLLLSVSEYMTPNVIILLAINILLLWPLAAYLLRTKGNSALLISLTCNVISIMLSVALSYLFLLSIKNSM